MSELSEIVRDTYDDSAEVIVASTATCDGTVVFLTVSDANGELALTPKQARRLAKALRKAAKLAKENA